jgi:hypothetical protein
MPHNVPTYFYAQPYYDLVGSLRPNGSLSITCSALPKLFFLERFRPASFDEILMNFFAGHLTQFIASIFAGLFLVTSVITATLLTNGSFETPVVPVGSFSSFAVGSSAITGWTVVGLAFHGAAQTTELHRSIRAEHHLYRSSFGGISLRRVLAGQAAV